ncbi:MAG: restriction endonuclease subunit S [Deltaproteobacteria bacterium]|nr:restriction endonuclease subunit S [Deltaproteobacteria bacterium]
MKLPVYQKYKPSGVEWLGDVPVHWEKMRLKFACTGIRTGGTPSPEYMDNADEKTVAWFTPADFRESLELNESSRKITSEAITAAEAPLFPAGTVFVVGIGTLGKVGFCNQPASANQQVNALLPHPGTDSRFLALLLSIYDEHMRALANSATLPILNQQRMGDIAIVLPPLLEQRSIADFLERETARLEALMKTKERLLELLAEKRSVLVTRAVTCGLDSDAPVCDSGLHWLGKISAHWRIERARWLFKERDERSETGEEEMLTVSHITGVTPRSEKDVNMFEAETTEGYKLCYRGDLVINTLWAWMGAMGVSPITGIVSPAYHVYTPSQELLGDYVDALVRTPNFAREVTRYSKGVWSSRLRLYPEGFFEVFLPVPPLPEQRAIVAHIATETAKLDALREATKRTIGLLKERRAALIAAAVTGRIAIPENTEDNLPGGRHEN